MLTDCEEALFFFIIKPGLEKNHDLKKKSKKSGFFF